MAKFSYATIELIYSRARIGISCTEPAELQAVLQAVQSFDPQVKLSLTRPKPRGRIDEFINSHERWLETVECHAVAQFTIAQFCQRGWEPYAHTRPDSRGDNWWIVSLRRRDE